MRHKNNIRQNASGAGRLGAGLLALLAALGRQADDVARFAGQHADDLSRGALQRVDGVGQFAQRGSDDLLRFADDATRPWTVPESRMCQPQSVVSAKLAADPGNHHGGEVLWHLAHKTGEAVLKSATEHDKSEE